MRRRVCGRTAGIKGLWVRLKVRKIEGYERFISREGVWVLVWGERGRRVWGVVGK